MNARTILLPVFVILTLAFASIALDESLSRTTVTTSTTTSTVTQVSIQTVTITQTPQSFPVTFLVPPSQCAIQGLCVIATLVDHLGQNLTVVLAAWVRNATTGQNVTGNGKDSVAYATCHITSISPEICYLIAYPGSLGTFEVTVYALSADGSTVISAAMTINATLR